MTTRKMRAKKRALKNLVGIIASMIERKEYKNSLELAEMIQQKGSEEVLGRLRSFLATIDGETKFSIIASEYRSKIKAIELSRDKISEARIQALFPSRAA